MNRRQFLRGAGFAGVALGSAAVIGAAAEGCGKAGAPAPTTPVTPSSTEGGPPPWAQLAASLSGSVVLPADPTYAVDKLLYNTRFDGLAPAAVAYCHSAGDVQRCVDFARRHDVQPSIRSGGHSYGGYSSGSGLVVDVTRLAGIDIDPDATSAVVGAGVRLIDLYSALGTAGVLVPGGSCPTVGIAGLALGGGVGVFGRNYGLTCDNVTSLEVVTADGRLLTCGPDHNEDLYWACRGGGGGNFGVATSFTFGLHRLPPVALFTLDWPAAAAVDVLGAWQAWTVTTPNELWSNCQLLSAGTSGLEVRVTGVWCGTPTTLSSLLGPLRTQVGVAATYDFVGPETYLRAMLIEAGCEDSTIAQCHLASQDPAGTLSRSTFAAKSGYVTAPLPGAGLATVVDSLQSLGQQLPDVGGGFVFDSYGGAINEVAPDATAFVHRDAIASVQYSVNWSSGTDGAVAQAAGAWLEAAQGALAPYVDGAYQNYIDPSLPDWEAAYYGSNLPRLTRVKRAYDPDGFFHFAQSVPLSHKG